MAVNRLGTRRRKIRKKLKKSLTKAIKLSGEDNSEFKLIKTRSIKKVFNGNIYYGLNSRNPVRFKGSEVSIREIKFTFKGIVYTQSTALHNHFKKVNSEEYKKHCSRQKSTSKKVKSVKQGQPVKKKQRKTA